MRAAIALSQKFKTLPLLKEVSLIIGCSLIIALFGLISIPLPFTPVPIVLQSHVCLLFGALLGPRRGALVVATFLAEGALGLPIFSGFKGGIHHLFGPTGGYLIGYVGAAYLAGLLVSRGKNHSTGSIFAKVLLSSLAIFFFGYLHLANFVGYASALTLGVLPFIVGDIIKSLGVAYCYRFFKK